MGKTTGIAWCHHTFNPFWGCVEVSPGCDRCYAREWAKRTGHAVWGADAPRRFFGPNHWAEPHRWQRAAFFAGERRRVFCASMGDVLEQRAGLPGRQLDDERKRLWDLIRALAANESAKRASSGLDWLLLTKRAKDWNLVPVDVLALPSVWPGVTVESPAYLWRAEALLKVDCAGPRWVSYEPALEWVDFSSVLPTGDHAAAGLNERLGKTSRVAGHGQSRADASIAADADAPIAARGCEAYANRSAESATGTDHSRSAHEAQPRARIGRQHISWLIIGGESQQAAKAGCVRPVAPFDLAWARRLLRLGRETGTAIFVKQVGARPIDWGRHAPVLDLRDRRAGADPAEWPEDLRVREFPR